MNVLAFALGLISLGLVDADVSHLRPNQYQHQQHAGSTFVANNGQFVKQSFNTNGDATYSSRSYNNAGNDANSKSRYWWMNTETLPFTKSNSHHSNTQNYFTNGCNGCASRALNIKHNTQQDAYSQNPFMNVKHNPSLPSPSYNRFQSAPVSGSPQEVNNFFQQQMFDSSRIQQSTPCVDSNSACVASKFCYNGFVDQSAEHKAQRSSVSVSLCVLCGDIARQPQIDRMNALSHPPTAKLEHKTKAMRRKPPLVWRAKHKIQFCFILMSNEAIKVGWKG